MKYLPLALLALLSLAPLAAACEGLSPGDELLVGDARCTLAFLLADKTGLYFATAGHCIKEGQTASSPDVGDFGVGYLHYLNPETGQSTDGSPGEDFALIKVDPNAYDTLNPKVCELEGPTGLYEETPGSGGVEHHGYGLVLGDLSPTRTRQGVNLHNNNTAFYWTGAGVPGDSGSSVLHESGKALGVLTHLQAGASTDTNGGTHLLRGFQLAKEMKGMNLRLVLMGEDPVAVLNQMRNATTSPPVKNGTLPGAGNVTQQNNSTAPQSNGSEPTGQTPPPGGAPEGDDLTPAANLDSAKGDGKTVPAPGVALVLVALAGLVAFRRRR